MRAADPRRAFAVAALAVLCSLPVRGTANAAAADPEMDRLMAALAARRHGHVTFAERKFIAILDRPVESEGELLYDAPDRLEKRTLKPRSESLVLEGGRMTAHRGHRQYVLDLSEYPQVLPFIESIRATLAGDRAALERVFTVRFEGSLAHWALGLAPLDARLAATVKSIRIEGETDHIRTVEIQEADGDHSLLTIGDEIAQ